MQQAVQRVPIRGISLSASVVVAIVAGLIIGWLDLRSIEVQPIAVLLLVVGAILGLVTHRGAWVAAIVLGLGVPTIHAALWVSGRPQPFPVAPPWSVLIAMVPAALGVAAGAAVRALFGARS